MASPNINSFSQSPIKGQQDMQFSNETISAIIDSTSAGNLVPGTPVKIIDSASGIPEVVECGADTDDVFGFINFGGKKSNYDAGDVCDISFFRGNVMFMEASAAIARGAKVMIVVSGIKVATATSGKTIVGRAFDKASADGDLIRVIIDLPGAAA